MKKPFLVIFDGPMGAGKSTVAKLLQKKLKGKTALISLDNLKKIVSDYKLDSILHLDLASKSGATMTNLYLKEGINVIVEKAFTREEFLKAFLKLIKGKPKIFIYQIEVSLKKGLERVEKRENEKIKRSMLKNKLKEKVLRNYSHYNEFKYKRAKIFNSEKLSRKKILNEILEDFK